MEPGPAIDASPAPALPDGLTLGPVHLAVAELDRSLDFYERAIGLRGELRGPGRAALSSGGEDLVVLVEEPGARRAGRHAGLYHFALLHPSREELGRALRRLALAGAGIEGASDHGISEAIYLPDPDGNGIELAADRGREHWGDLRDITTISPRPLDLGSLLEMAGDAEPPELADPRLRVGHVHLHVGGITEALGFYRDLVGLEVMTLIPTAAFVSAGGYHHHLGLNTWRGPGVPPAPPGWSGCAGGRSGFRGAPTSRRFAPARGGGAELSVIDAGLLVHDPWDHAVLIEASPGG